MTAPLWLTPIVATSTLVRPATAADASFLAWGLDEAAGGLFESLLGPRSREILTTLASQPAHAYSYEHAMIAEVDGQLLGFCHGFPDGTPPGDSALMKAAGVRMVRAFGVMLALLPVMTALQRHAPGEWYLQAIAVTPESRGTGVGSVLFADAIARAKAAGCESLVLDVDVANERARELYERLGLMVTSTSGRAILAGNARVHRMGVTLEGSARY